MSRDRDQLILNHSLPEFLDFNLVGNTVSVVNIRIELHLAILSGGETSPPPALCIWWFGP